MIIIIILDSPNNPYMPTNKRNHAIHSRPSNYISNSKKPNNPTNPKNKNRDASNNTITVITLTTRQPRIFSARQRDSRLPICPASSCSTSGQGVSVSVNVNVSMSE